MVQSHDWYCDARVAVQFYSRAARHGLCVLRTSDESKSLTAIASGAFIDVVATTASPARPIVSAAVSALSFRCNFNAAYAGLGTLPDGPLVKSSERSFAPLDGQRSGNAGGSN